jgi:hypothetical protein
MCPPFRPRARLLVVIQAAAKKASTKARVEHGKVWTAAQLARKGVDFLFFEMDVWLIKVRGGGGG